ncbi:DUF192 domain-containing protein [Aminobacter aganoensis]|uniref:DUF192 domain-containing protein n=1 Tax=Aminobacter aganoensis TaxID=83264 RepID=A0A7X0F7Q7_9HYPH|nr:MULTISPECIES: DUF192 domain-containing protein [Aminobacter]KQU75763.1 hypothetical protein ASC75_17180 [Aminobacter sp. DSM 101952]MBB6354604.1 hypothetical protein [Aminobacter aganoensis]
MTRRKSLLAGMTGAAWLAAAVFVVSLSSTPPVLAQQAMALPADPEPLVAVTAKGEVSFRIEVADEPGERAMGLMHRKDLADDQGMLFVFEQTQPVGFWMKNTPLPLDLVFVGPDGKVLDIQQGTPFSEAVIAPDEPARFVLELKAGTAARTGIADGIVLKHRAITAAAGNPG